jgi:hypothetical protein
MKKKLVLLLSLFLALPLMAHAATMITFTWTNPVYPTCSATVTTWCLTGATLTDTTANVVASSTIPAGAATYTYTPAGGIPFGYVHSFSLVLNAVDGNGKPIVSGPATTTVTYSTLDAPTGFTATVQ